MAATRTNPAATLATAAGLAACMAATPAAALNVTQPPYNAICDGTTDDTAALQAAIDAGQGEVVIPRFCRTTSALQVTHPVAIRGVGRFLSGLVLGSPTADGIDIATDLPVELRDFGIMSPNGQTAGAMVSVTGTTKSNADSIFARLRLTGAFVAFDFIAAAYWTLDNVRVYGWGPYGVHVRNAYIADEGDSLITASLFSQPGSGGQPGSSGVAIFQETGSGLKIQGTKILGGSFGVMAQLPPGVTASDLLITGCSIENQANTGILLIGGPSGAWYNVTITGNELEAAHYPIVVSTFGGTWLHGLTITGNVADIMQAGGRGQGITVEGAEGFTVGSNVIRNLSGGGYGVVIGPHSSNGQVLHNAYSWVATPVFNMSVSTRVDP